MQMIVSPSYGRDYKSKKAVLADWLANLDFTIESFGPDMGRQINLQDAEMGNVASINVRYSNMRKVAVLKKTSKGWRIS